MEHKHTPASNHIGDIKVAFFLNLAFTVFELVGGLWTNSLAIISDSLHDLGDSFSLGLSWYLANYSEREEDERFTYGYRRFSLLGALSNTIVLIVGSLFILQEAIPRLMQPEHSNAPGMVFFAIVGIAVNGLAALRVKGGQSLNAQVVAWHLLEDVLGWVAVLVVSVILLFQDIHILDPILSLLITLYVLYNVLRNLKKTLALFLQAVPGEVDVNEIDSKLRAIDDVCSTHHTHVWSLDGEHHVLSTHLIVADDTTREQVLSIKRRVRELIGDANFEHVTLEIEYENEDCSMEGISGGKGLD